jgi:hypothetical protein
MLAHGGGVCSVSRVAAETAAMAIARQAANNNGGIIKSMALWLWRSAAAWQRSNSESIGVGDPLSAASLIKISAAAINNGMKKHTKTAMAHRRRQRRQVAEMYAEMAKPKIIGEMAVGENENEGGGKSSSKRYR